MPVTATPVPPPLLTRDDIRGFLRDVAGEVPGTGALNTLLDNVLFSDVDIDRAIKFTVARFNAMTPVSRVSADTINLWVLLNGTVANLLNSESVRQLMNQASFQDGDVAPIGIDDKSAPYAQLAAKFSEEFQITARGIKTEANMNAAWGGLGSGYRATSRYHHA